MFQLKSQAPVESLVLKQVTLPQQDPAKHNPVLEFDLSHCRSCPVWRAGFFFGAVRRQTSPSFGHLHVLLGLWCLPSEEILCCPWHTPFLSSVVIPLPHLFEDVVL